MARTASAVIFNKFGCFSFIGTETRLRTKGHNGMVGSRGESTVKSAYRLASRRTEEVTWGGCKRVWKMKMSSQCVRVFMWIMTHGKLLTNLERWKRRLTGCPYCISCNRASEDVLHIVGECKWAREVLEHLIPPEFLCDLFSLDLEAWVLWMLKGRRSAGEKLIGQRRL